MVNEDCEGGGSALPPMKEDLINMPSTAFESLESRPRKTWDPPFSDQTSRHCSVSYVRGSMSSSNYSALASWVASGR
jgi:hypothetical protein